MKCLFILIILFYGIDTLSTKYRLVSSEPRINNGIDSIALAHVAQILVFRIDVPEVIQYGCGVIISSHSILTTAHLVTNHNSIQIGYGSVNLFQLQTIMAEMVMIHEGYNSVTRENDIAILSISSEITWNENVYAGPIRLQFHLNSPGIGQMGTVAGFGYTQPGQGFPNYILQSTMQSVIDRHHCMELINSTFPITNTHFCAINYEEQSGVCTGDNGTGMFITSGVPILIGIASNFMPDCNGQYPAAFTQISLFHTWILQNMII